MAQLPPVYLMSSEYPCRGDRGLAKNHELGDGPPRESMCGMVVDGRAYRDAVQRWATESMSDPMLPMPRPEEHAACLCVGSLPLLPERCPPNQATCGIYPNDPAKKPEVLIEVTGDIRAGFCELHDGKFASNFIPPLHDPARETRLWAQMCGVPALQ